jgi:murein DD-endopeptidase MepM/ murein hydrolase activator NlpD
VRTSSALVSIALCAASLACDRPRPGEPVQASRAVDIDLRDDTTSLAARVTGGMTFASLLSAHLAPAEAAPVIAAAQAVFDARRMRTGQPYRLVQTIDGALKRFEYEIDNDLFLRIVRSAAESPWVAAVLPIPKTHAKTVLTGSISRESPSLFGAVAAAGGTIDLALALADIFSGDIDFNTELQPGDTFALVVDKQLRDKGEFAGYGPIFAAEFANDGRQLKAIRFEPESGKAAYFDERGTSMRRFMLKSPLKFDPVVTSGFSRNRLHPVLGETRAHLGVDYRAPVGAPVVAVSNGVVVRAGMNGAAGRMVQLRHANGFETEYLHLSAITVRTGSRVQQGDLIGRVGATGLVTGPHLDYRVKRDGVFINPVTASRSMPPGEPVPAAEMEAFQLVRDRELSALDTPVARTDNDEDSTP